jgi:hypothetical protein
MTEPDNIVIQHLRAIREQLDTLNERQLEMTQRLGSVDLGLADVSMRVDRIDARLDRLSAASV